MPASPTASTSRWLFSQPPNARNCMKSRAFDRCGCPSFIPPFSLRSGGSGPRRASLMARLYSAQMPYLVREATLDDSDVLIHHRVAMFSDMGEPFDRAALEASYREWLA